MSLAGAGAPCGGVWGAGRDFIMRWRCFRPAHERRARTLDRRTHLCSRSTRARVSRIVGSYLPTSVPASCATVASKVTVPLAQLPRSESPRRICLAQGPRICSIARRSERSARAGACVGALAAPSFEVSRVGFEFERQRLSHLWIALAWSAAITAGCRTAPCPDGSVRDGNVCRRVHSDAGTDQLGAEATPARSPAAGSGSGGRAGSSAKTGTSPKASQTAGSGTSGNGAAGSADREQSSSDVAGRSGSAGSSARAAAGSSGSEAEADSSDVPARSGTPSAGKSGSGKAGAGGTVAASAGRGGAGGDPDSSASGSDDSDEGGAGTSGSAGEPGEDAAAGSGGASAESAGSSSSSDGGSSSSEDPNPAWTCLQVDESCVCVHAGSSAGDLCNAPRPTCCYQLPMPAGDCVCAPEGTQQCLTTGGNPLGMRVGQCPPPR